MCMCLSLKLLEINRVYHLCTWSIVVCAEWSISKEGFSNNNDLVFSSLSQWVVLFPDKQHYLRDEWVSRLRDWLTDCITNWMTDWMTEVCCCSTSSGGFLILHAVVGYIYHALKIFNSNGSPYVNCIILLAFHVSSIT